MRDTNTRAALRILAAGLFFALTTCVDAQAIKAGDTVDVQLGTRMVRGKVESAEPDGSLVVGIRGQVVEAYARDAVLVKDRGQRMSPVRIKAGDIVRDRLSKQEGKVLSIDKETVSFSVESRGRVRKATSMLAEMEKIGGSNTRKKERRSKPAHKVREWVDDTGKHKVKATFVSAKGGKVQLKRATNGKIFELAIDKLSKADKSYVESFEVRYVEFTPPSGLQPHFTAVSRSEKFGVIGYGKSKRDPLSTFVILDLNKTKKWRNVRVENLDGAECRAVSDDGKFVLTEHQVTDSIDEQKRAKMSYYWTIWDCSTPKAVVAKQMKKPPIEMHASVATWIDDTKVFIGSAEGKVMLLEQKDGKFEEVYEKKVGDPAQLGVISVSPNGKYFVVENGRKSAYEVYSTANCKRVQRAPSGSYLVHLALNDSMLVGVTRGYQTVAWDLRKKKLVGGGTLQRGGQLASHLGSPAARMWPLGKAQAVFVRKIYGEYQVKAIVNCGNGTMVGLSAPHVLTKGSGRRIWYVTDNGSEFRYQAYSIPNEIGEAVQVPGFD